MLKVLHDGTINGKEPLFSSVSSARSLNMVIVSDSFICVHFSNDWWLATVALKQMRLWLGVFFLSWMRSARVGVYELLLYKRCEWASTQSSFVEWSLWGQSNANPTHLNTPFDRQMTTAVMKGFVLLICLFFTVVQSITCEANRIDARKKHENDVAHHSSAITTGNTYSNLFKINTNIII